MKESTKIKLSPRYRKLVIQELNKVLDEYKIYGKEWTIEILIEFIQNNLYLKDSIELIERLEKSTISDWNE